MCEIQEIVKMTDGTFVYCTSTPVEFMNSTAVKFFNGGNSFMLKKFSMGRARQCFSDNPIAPVIKLEEDVPDNFLKRGNPVAFEA